MRIAHLCLSNFYIDDFNYQENAISRYNKRNGNEVCVIASTETYDSERRLSYCSAGSYFSPDGIQVQRVPYVSWLPMALAKKARIHPGVYQKLEEFGPDVILFHGLCGFELLTVARYKRHHPQVRLFADSHEDPNNSARTWFSRYLLHRLYYGTIARRAAREIERIFCVSLETIDFVRSTYRIPEGKLEYLPLGGEVLDEAEFREVRTAVRVQYGFREDEIIVLQGGKMGWRKKLLETLKVFRAVRPARCRLVLVGAIDDSIRAEAEELMKDAGRIEFLGWKSGAEVTRLLCGADVYLQPGTQSALLQNAICARCAIIAADVPSHKPYLRDNGWLIDSTEALEGAIRQLESRAADLPSMRAASAAVALDLLDYAKISERAIGR